MNEQQNKFYTSISTYYSEIFPYKPLQLQFVKGKVGDLTSKQILDIGCATGELSFHLAEEGAEVTGTDLNEDLLNRAKAQKQHKYLHFQKGDMLELEKDFSENRFDAVLCFGNTLVHLPDKNNVLKLFHGVRRVLKPNGKFLLQILNYDYILDEKVSELPLIETANIKFVRKYKFEEDSTHLLFKTDLHLKTGDKVISNETGLLALRSSELLDLLEQSGLKNIQLFSNFKGEEFSGKHLPLIVSADN